MAASLVKTAYGISADPSDASVGPDPTDNRRRGRKPINDAAEAKAYFRGVNDGTEYMIKRMVEQFEEEYRTTDNGNNGLFTLDEIKRIIQREEW